MNRDLDRYRTLLAIARESLRSRFTREEQLLICDVLNGTLVDPFFPGIIVGDVEDALPDNITAKWHVPAAPLLATLRSLTPIEELALIDAVERWWKNGDTSTPVL